MSYSPWSEDGVCVPSNTIKVPRPVFRLKRTRLGELQLQQHFVDAYGSRGIWRDVPTAKADAPDETIWPHYP